LATRAPSLGNIWQILLSSTKHGVLIIGRNGIAVAHGDIGLSLDDAQTLLGAIQDGAASS
jgi:hypothetical protein